MVFVLQQNSKIQNLNTEFDELFRDLHGVQEDIRRELNAINGKLSLLGQIQDMNKIIGF